MIVNENAMLYRASQHVSQWGYGPTNPTILCMRPSCHVWTALVDQSYMLALVDAAFTHYTSPASLRAPFCC